MPPIRLAVAVLITVTLLAMLSPAVLAQADRISEDEAAPRDGGSEYEKWYREQYEREVDAYEREAIAYEQQLLEDKKSYEQQLREHKKRDVVSFAAFGLLIVLLSIAGVVAVRAQRKMWKTYEDFVLRSDRKSDEIIALLRSIEDNTRPNR